MESMLLKKKSYLLFTLKLIELDELIKGHEDIFSGGHAGEVETAIIKKMQT